MINCSRVMPEEACFAAVLVMNFNKFNCFGAYGLDFWEIIREESEKIFKFF